MFGTPTEISGQFTENFATSHRKFRPLWPPPEAAPEHDGVHPNSSGARRRTSKIARQSSAHRRTASEAARAQFASTLEPLRLRTLRPPALKIDRPSKYQILAYVSKLASQLLQSGELEHPPRERSLPETLQKKLPLSPLEAIKPLVSSLLSLPSKPL